MSIEPGLVQLSEVVGRLNWRELDLVSVEMSDFINDHIAQGEQITPYVLSKMISELMLEIKKEVKREMEEAQREGLLPNASQHATRNDG